MDVNAVLTGTVFSKKKEYSVFAVESADRPGRSSFSAYFDDTWSGFDIAPDWPAIGMAWTRIQSGSEVLVVATSSEGHLWELEAGSGEEKESVIPGDHTGITKLATIGELIWACGMGRLVLRREANGTWSNVSAPEPSLEDGVIGFNGIAGVGEEVTAVGWAGEIWTRVKDRWEAQDSGTNTNLNAVSVGADGGVVAVGDHGTVVVGRRNEWSVLEINIDFNFQGVCHFGDEVFVCSDFDLYRLEKGRLTKETRFPKDDEQESCMNLIVGKESVFSQGEKDVFRFQKGLWTRAF
jgi:hypothetical protein